jgi:hypothetical protein
MSAILAFLPYCAQNFVAWRNTFSLPAHEKAIRVQARNALRQPPHRGNVLHQGGFKSFVDAWHYEKRSVHVRRFRVSKALEARHPRFRYPVGPFARLNHAQDVMKCGFDLVDSLKSDF